MAAANSSSVRTPVAWSRPRSASRSAIGRSDAAAGPPGEPPPAVAELGTGGEAWRRLAGRHPRRPRRHHRRTRSQPHLRPESGHLGLVDRGRHGASPVAGGGGGHRPDRRHLRGRDPQAVAADRADQVFVRAHGGDRDEVEAELPLGPDMVQEHLVVAVRAGQRRDLAEVLRLVSGTEDHDHAQAPRSWTRPPRGRRRGRSDPDGRPGRRRGSGAAGRTGHPVPV